MRALMLGRTLLGERVFDVDRGLELLQARFDADLGKVRKRLVERGSSGGRSLAVAMIEQLLRDTGRDWDRRVPADAAESSAQAGS